MPSPSSFPVWWWSLPGDDQGLDRPGVEQRLGLWRAQARASKALLLATAAGNAESYAKRGYDQAMRVQILTGTMEYCGIPESELHLLFDALDTGSAGPSPGDGATAGERYFGTVGVGA